MADPTIPVFSTQLWTDAVGLAGGPETDPPGYTFSNGRTFRITPYDAPVPAPVEPE